MRGRQPVHTAELARHILAQLSSGRSLRAVCRDDGMPALNTVLKWVRDDIDGFAARYRQALRIGNAPRGRPSLYTDETADRILEELSNGRRVCEICGDPGMPSAAAVKLWVMEDRNGFAARYRRARDICEVGMGRRTLYTPHSPNASWTNWAAAVPCADFFDPYFEWLVQPQLDRAEIAS